MSLLKNKVILITGGGGYLGSKLAEHFSNSDNIIKLLDINFNNISQFLAASKHNVELVNVDIRDKSTLFIKCREIQPDYVFHFAAIIDRTRNFELFKKISEVNVLGTFNLLQSLKNVCYKGLFLASTSEIYGTTNDLPFHEEQTPEPASPYSLSKFMSETLCKTYSQINNKPYTILRFFNFYGPEMPKETFIGQVLWHLKNNQTLKMTGGQQKRDLLFIDDLIDQITFLLLSNYNLYDTYNICNGYSHSIFEVAKLFSEATNNQFKFVTSLDYRPNEIWDMYGSNKRILDLGYSLKNKLPLKDTINKIIDL